MELVYNRSFTLTTGRGRKSRPRRLKNGVHQGSVLALILFNVYIHKLPSISLRLYVFADDLTLVYPAVEWPSLEKTINQDMATVSSHFEIGD